jgi:hypothetical protein
MTNKNKHNCGVCAEIRAHLRAHFGMYLPWAFLIAGGIASALPLSTKWSEGAAYLVVISLAWFFLLVVRRRLISSFSTH